MLQSPGAGGWHFISIDQEKSAEIKAIFGIFSKNWGSLAVVAQIGNSIWNTSIFRDKESQAYLLPVKAKIRKIENIKSEDVVDCQITLES